MMCISHSLNNAGKIIGAGETVLSVHSWELFFFFWWNFELVHKCNDSETRAQTETAKNARTSLEYFWTSHFSMPHVNNLSLIWWKYFCVEDHRSLLDMEKAVTAHTSQWTKNHLRRRTQLKTFHETHTLGLWTICVSKSEFLSWQKWTFGLKRVHRCRSLQGPICLFTRCDQPKWAAVVHSGTPGAGIV